MFLKKLSVFTEMTKLIAFSGKPVPQNKCLFFFFPIKETTVLIKFVTEKAKAFSYLGCVYNYSLKKYSSEWVFGSILWTLKKCMNEEFTQILYSYGCFYFVNW